MPAVNCKTSVWFTGRGLGFTIPAVRELKTKIPTKLAVRMGGRSLSSTLAARLVLGVFNTSLLSQFKELQGILCCPRTRSGLSLVTTAELLGRLPEEERRRLPEGTTGAFVSESSLTAYPIVGRIADFLEQDSLMLSRDRVGERTDLDSDSVLIQQGVKQWYDEFGWQRNAAGMYYDTALSSQLSLTAHGVYELFSHMSLLDRLCGGDFVLDAASGAIAHPEYLAYSWFYKYRVCVDISLTALREADAKLAGTGFCCMANVCQLPFREGVFDGVVSGYTIQHIPESQQSKAVGELYRVLKPGGHLCIISHVQRARALRALVSAVRAMRKTLALLSINGRRANAQSPQASTPSRPPHPLYFHVQDLAWWRQTARSLADSYAVEGFRLFQKKEFESLFGDSMRAAKTVRALESLFPRLAARMSAYLLVDLSKRSGKATL